MDYLPKDQKELVKSAMRAAFSMEADQGKKKLKQLAKWLELEHPSASASLLEGLDEMFTINILGLPKTLRRCLGTTNIIDSPHSGMRSRCGRVKNWQDHKMVIRWSAVSLLDAEKRFKRIMGYQQIWILDARLKELAESKPPEAQLNVA